MNTTLICLAMVLLVVVAIEAAPMEKEMAHGSDGKLILSRCRLLCKKRTWYDGNFEITLKNHFFSSFSVLPLTLTV